MSKRDKKKWLQLFYTKWGYRPASEIRKKPEYVNKVPLEEALEIASDNDKIQPTPLIQIVFPFTSCLPISKQPPDTVTIFPQTVYYNKNKLFEIEEPILYDGVFYSLDDFISTCPDVSLDNAEGMFGTFAFSLPFFMLETEETNEFKKLYLTPVKSKIIETGFYLDNRGTKKKPDPDRAERDKFIIKAYGEIPKKKTLPIKAIGQRLAREALEKFSNDTKKFNMYNCTSITIRRVLQRYTEK